MREKVVLDKLIYNSVQQYLIKNRLDKIPVGRVLADVNVSVMNQVGLTRVIQGLQRYADYEYYSGRFPMFVWDGFVYLNS